MAEQGRSDPAADRIRVLIPALTRAQIDADILAAVAALGYSSARIIYDTDGAIYAAGMERAALLCEAIPGRMDCVAAIRAAAKGAM